LYLLTKVAAPKVATYALVNPVVALLLGAAILSEPVTPLVIMATVLVLVGVGLVLFQDVFNNARFKSSVTRRGPAVARGE
jgi:drug/metabolite transporter (DMT)-like permease